MFALVGFTGCATVDQTTQVVTEDLKAKPSQGDGFVTLTVLMATFALGDEVENTRCGGNLVEVGDSVVTVLGKCGEPTWRVGEGGFTILYYESSQDELIKMILIEDEKVDSIKEVAR
jgi:hypothetical protein